MRKLAIASLLLALAGCKVAEDLAQASEQAKEQAGGDEIACAHAADTRFTADCWFERSDTEDTKIVVVHHPDGSFRRFQIVDDGRGLISADGSEELSVAVMDDMIQVTLADYRYLFPATIASNAGSE